MAEETEHESAEVEEGGEDPDDGPFNEALIVEVEKYPALYEKSSKKNKDKVRKQNGWQSVSLALKEMFSVGQVTDEEFTEYCEKKWTTLRNGYTRALARLKKKPSGSGRDESVTARPYKFAKQMEFLRSHLRDRRTLSNIKPTGPPKTAEFASGNVLCMSTTDTSDMQERMAAINNDASEDETGELPSPLSVTSSSVGSGSRNKGKDNFLNEFLEQQRKETEKFLQALSSDTEKLDEVDHQARVWALRIKKFTMKTRRDIMRAITAVIDTAEDETGLFN